MLTKKKVDKKEEVMWEHWLKYYCGGQNCTPLDWADNFSKETQTSLEEVLKWVKKTGGLTMLAAAKRAESIIAMVVKENASV